jgi:hypothetical protein
VLTITTVLRPCASPSPLQPSKQDFINRNFTEKEISYAVASADPASTYAGRWAAKEAVVKAISSTKARRPLPASQPASQPASRTVRRRRAPCCDCRCRPFATAPPPLTVARACGVRSRT